jgi:hypothetical protein
MQRRQLKFRGRRGGYAPCKAGTTGNITGRDDSDFGRDMDPQGYVAAIPAQISLGRQLSTEAFNGS